MEKIELELEKAIGDSRLLGKKIEKKIKNLEKTIEAHKKLKKESEKEFLTLVNKIFKTRSYPYKDMGFCGEFINHHVIMGGILYTFGGVDKESQKIILRSGYLNYFKSRRKKQHNISLSLDEFLEKTDQLMKSIREKDSFKKGDDVFINDSKFFWAFKKDDGKVFMNNGDKKANLFYRGEILRIFENNTAIVLLLFPGIGGPMTLEVLVDLKQLRHTTFIDDIYNRIKENNFEISEMNGFKIGDQICYKNNKTPKFEDKGEFYYNMEIYYNDFAPNTFKILGFINDKVIVGSYKRSKEDYIQSFIINDIEEIEKL